MSQQISEVELRLLELMLKGYIGILEYNFGRELTQQETQTATVAVMKFVSPTSEIFILPSDSNKGN